MGPLVIGLIVLALGAVLSLVAGKSPRLSTAFGAGAAVVGSLLALAGAVQVLYQGSPVEMSIPWQVPFGNLSLGLDPLSAIFVLPVAVVVMAASIYGAGYLRGHGGVGLSWFFFNALAATMLSVVAARNGLFFLISWEGMSLASFFLVMSEYRQESVRRAGWTYLVAMHLGTAFLLALFLLLGKQSGSLDFDQFAVEPAWAGILFVLAVVGFGTKAGFMPVHVWLPEAHPAAPSHVSAVMSGVMIKTGIYGLCRTLTFLGEPQPWWGWTLIAIGVSSAVLGVLFASAQHDLKRLLAYSSVENIGIIAIGLGVGLLGVSYGVPAMAALGFLGAILHVLNHAMFKTLLFLGAGAVQRSTGTRRIDRLGGLLKRMPVTGTVFLIGSSAISGLPPLNGFVSEVLIYLAVLAGVADGIRAGGVPWAILCVLVIGGLSLVGGLAAACFTKAFGCVFLGEPRSQEAGGAGEVNLAMRASLVGLAAACGLVALTAPLWPWLLWSSAAMIVPGALPESVSATAGQPVATLAAICGSFWALLAVAAVLVRVRRRLLADRHVQRGPTWDCGYAAPTARMQYTASSFSSPLASLFRMFLRPRIELAAGEGLFPANARFESDTPEVFREYLFRPIFLAVSWASSRLRWLQHGRLQLYVLYIALTTLVLLIWKLG